MGDQSFDTVLIFYTSMVSKVILEQLHMVPGHDFICKVIKLYKVLTFIFSKHCLRKMSQKKFKHHTDQVSRFFSLASLSYFSKVLLSTMPVRYLEEREGTRKDIHLKGLLS